MAENLTWQAVCLFTGDGLPDEYAVKLLHMLQRHAPEPWRLAALTDRKRDLPSEIEQIDVSGWPLYRPDLRGTQRRLLFFDPDFAPFEEFTSLDVTLVVKGDLGPLIQFGRERRETLVIVDDWNHPTVNGSVMRIRRGPGLLAIAEDYRSGVRYPAKIMGDQDFIDASYKAHGLQHEVAFWPPEMIVSYRVLRKLNRTNPAKARALLDAACILKFHGNPRPHDLISFQGLLREALHSPGHVFTDWGFLSREVREWWA
jgi:hypothetical protein